MTSWWEAERWARFQMQDRMSEAERDRLIRWARDADSRHAGLVSLVAAWLRGGTAATWPPYGDGRSVAAPLPDWVNHSPSPKAA